MKLVTMARLLGLAPRSEECPATEVPPELDESLSEDKEEDRRARKS